MKVLFDTVKKKNVDEYWINNNGEIFINSNPYGAMMNSSISICIADKNRYELRDDVNDNDSIKFPTTCTCPNGYVNSLTGICLICRLPLKGRFL